MLDPATVAGAIFWGVISGIFTSVILFMTGLFVTKVAIPWYQSLVFKGVDLSGTWSSNKDFPHTRYQYILVLRQAAHDLAGTMIITRSGKASTGGDYIQGMSVTGSSWEGFVTLNMQSDDRRSLSFATSLLKIKDRGDTLIGEMAYRSRGADDQVRSETIEWRRGQ